jgi:hypothetical protein
VIPSWYGDSVGHYDGETLVIGTVGIKIGPFGIVDRFGTPQTEALHVVERYRLIDYEAAMEAQERGLKEWVRVSDETNDAGLRIDPDYKGKELQLQLTVDDEGVFTMPWSATVTYRPGLAPYGRKMSVPRTCGQPTSQRTAPSRGRFFLFEPGTIWLPANYCCDGPPSPIPPARPANPRRNWQLSRLRVIYLGLSPETARLSAHETKLRPRQSPPA